MDDPLLGLPASASYRSVAQGAFDALAFELADVTQWSWPDAAFDVVALIFTQFATPAERATMFAGVRKALKLGGLLLIEGAPGKGKTALMAHLIEEVFGHYAPRPVHFFYRRTASITDPDVC